MLVGEFLTGIFGEVEGRDDGVGERENSLPLRDDGVLKQYYLICHVSGSFDFRVNATDVADEGVYLIFETSLLGPQRL